MMFTLTKYEVRRLLNLKTMRDVDALITNRVLIPAAYSAKGRELYDALDVQRAALLLIEGPRDGDPVP
jgi:hypothetical protein